MLRKLNLMVLFILVAGLSVYGQFSQVINYQGKLTDKDNNVLSGTFTIAFKLYKGASGGTEVWSESRSVQVDQGNYNVLLGSQTGFPQNLFTTNLWLGITVGNDSEMTPRTMISPAPTAIVADTCLAMVGMIGIFPAVPKDGWLLCKEGIGS